MSYIDKVRAANGVSVRFRARWRDPSGKEKAKTFATKAEAQDFLVSIEHAKKSHSYVDPQAGKVLVGTYAEQWLAGKDVRPSTAARDASYVRSYILPHFGEVRLGAVRHLRSMLGRSSYWRAKLPRPSRKL